MFHAHSGWFFERLPDGGVRISQREGQVPEGGSLFKADFDAAAWASIVASVSAGGEEDGRFYAAREFHDSKGRVGIGREDGMAPGLDGGAKNFRTPGPTSFRESPGELRNRAIEPGTTGVDTPGVTQPFCGEAPTPSAPDGVAAES